MDTERIKYLDAVNLYIPLRFLSLYEARKSISIKRSANSVSVKGLIVRVAELEREASAGESQQLLCSKCSRMFGDKLSYLMHLGDATDFNVYPQRVDQQSRDIGHVCHNPSDSLLSMFLKYDAVRGWYWDGTKTLIENL